MLILICGSDLLIYLFIQLFILVLHGMKMVNKRGYAPAQTLIRSVECCNCEENFHSSNQMKCEKFDFLRGIDFI